MNDLLFVLLITALTLLVFFIVALVFIFSRTLCSRKVKGYGYLSDTSGEEMDLHDALLDISIRLNELERKSGIVRNYINAEDVVKKIVK